MEIELSDWYQYNDQEQQENESLATKEYSTFFSDEVPNGRIPKTETVSTAMYGSLPRDDLLLEPLPP